MSIFENKFLANLNEDAELALHQLCYKYERMYKYDKRIDVALEFYAIIEAFLDVHELKYKLPNISTETTEKKIEMVLSFAMTTRLIIQPLANAHHERLELKRQRKQYGSFFEKPFIYEFTDNDVSRIQLLLNELRDKISSNGNFEEKHKRRLMKRLESLQNELHKQMSDLDHFWGLVGDAGVVIGKFGKNAKPLVDRIKEITNIVWKAQSEAEALPNDSKSPSLLSSEVEE